MNKEPNSAKVPDPSMLKLIQKLLLIPGEFVSSQVVIPSTRLKKDIVEKAMDILEGARLGKKIFALAVNNSIKGNYGMKNSLI